LKSHIAFFTKHYSLNTKFNVKGAKGPFHIIREGTETEGTRVCELTKEGLESLDKTVCRGTSAFGKVCLPNDDIVPGDVHVAQPDTIDTLKSTKLPLCPVYEATLGGSSGQLGQGTNFTAVEESMEPLVLAGKVPVALQVEASPAILSLFLRTSHCEFQSLPEGLKKTTHNIQRHLCQPNVNTREVTDIGRLHNAKKFIEDTNQQPAQVEGEKAVIVMSDEAGLIQTAMGHGKPGNNFIDHDFYLVPYSICDSATAPEGSAEVTTVEVTMDLRTSLEGHPKAKLIAMEDVQSLWVALFTEQAEIKPEFDADDGSENKATKAFAQLIGTMQQAFGGLKTAEDWVKLYIRLCNCDQLSPYNFGRLATALPWPELNYMVHHLMGAVSPLGIGLLDGLGRVSATKLATMSRYPETTYKQLLFPNKAFTYRMTKSDFRVVGEPAIVKCIAMNQGGTFGKASLKMCREFSQGVLRRATQPTKVGIRDLLSDYLNKANAKRGKYAFTNMKEMISTFNKLREDAYDIVFEEGTSNSHLKLLHAIETVHKKKTLQQVKALCIKNKWGLKNETGITECFNSVKGHPLVFWLVNIMTNGFFFATKEETENQDFSYSEMLILVRTNGNQGMIRGKPEDNLYNASIVANFKVCNFISCGLSVASL
jgi:hypothetical protein